jgi:biotin operon repressor
VAALTGCSRQTVLRHIATLKERGAVDTRHSGRRTIVIPLRPGHGATRAFFNAIEDATRRQPAAQVQNGHRA